MHRQIDDIVADLRKEGFSPGDRLGIGVAADVGIGLCHEQSVYCLEAKGSQLRDAIEELTVSLNPRWLWWDRTASAELARLEVFATRCWDVLTVHRLLHGGWSLAPAQAWAVTFELDLDDLPQMGQLGLLDAPQDEGSDFENPVLPSGHLRPEWAAGAWRTSPTRLGQWARLACQVAEVQDRLLARSNTPSKALSTAHSESLASLLCSEMEAQGLPLNESVVQNIIGASAGPRPASYAEEDRYRAERDAEVLKHVPGTRTFNLRSPEDVKSLLRRVEVDLPDTRAWRLEEVRDRHPVVDALLTWRKAERVATTYGYRWLDEHVQGQRLRGVWTESDGAAGRMTASAGLHNLPTEMRSAVASDPGWVFVRADLGQIEPRVLASVSGDIDLCAATQEDDLYLPIATQLNVTREVAKVAVLGAMYGSTTGESAHALRGLATNYPTAMAHLDEAAAAGQAGNDVFTVGGRRVRMWVDPTVTGDLDRARQVAAARGRFARNAIIQGAAAEFFKVWAALVRAAGKPLGASIVLCLHDELLVHTPQATGEAMAQIVEDCVDKAAHYWSQNGPVRFLADVSIISNWAQAKD